jgi:hypothetical protein
MSFNVNRWLFKTCVPVQILVPDSKRSLFWRSRYTVQTLHPSLNYRLLLLLIEGMVKGMNSIWPLITQLCWHPQTPVRRYKALGSWVPSNHIQPILLVLMDAGQQPPNGRGPAPLIEGKIPLSTLF